MRRWRPPSRLTLAFVSVWAILAWMTGCSRQMAVPGSTGTTSNGQLPFDHMADGSGVSPTAAFASEGIPAGTQISIRLGAALSSADAQAGDSFDAVLDESLVVAGNTLLLRGAPVTGRVVDTKVGARHDPGYLRITLASIAINGRSIPLQTSSIFTKGGWSEKLTAATNGSQASAKRTGPQAVAESAAGTGPSYATIAGDVRFSTGRRFTFRLIQPLHL